MYLQSIKSIKHNAAMSVNRSILKKRQHKGFGVFIVHSSMLWVLPEPEAGRQASGHAPGFLAVCANASELNRNPAKIYKRCP
jgi:hypothetical protein